MLADISTQEFDSRAFLKTLHLTTARWLSLDARALTFLFLSN
jgi:hypothetical protein